MSELTPITRKEHIMSGTDITPITREEMFLQKIVEGGGGSSLPSYTSSDVGKVLTVVEDSEHPTQHTVIPEQTATLEKTAGDVWLYLFDENSGVDTDFFENASVGDKCFISIDGAEYVESTAVAVYDMALFPVGDYYVGYASTFGGMGVASLETSPKTNITITAYANVIGQLAEWRAGVLIVNINPYLITPSSDYYPQLKAAYDDGAKLFARVVSTSSNTDSYSAGTLTAVSYDSANDQFKARISYIQDGTSVYMAVADVTIYNDSRNFSKSNVYKVEMTMV